jgi:GntR family transcriptional regulator, transcriptional repressor for pyruvate dehydrogenase complex
MTRPLLIKKTTLADQVCKIIKERIRDGAWTEGSRLPSENELAESFGVNRMTVRNALQKLNAMGIVETRAGEGTFVKQFDIFEYISEISGLLTSSELLDGVMEFRKCIEVECGRLAILKADSVDVEELENACVRYETVAKNQDKPFVEHIEDIINADLDFHYHICKMSKNSLFTLSYTTARELIFQYIRSVLLNRYVNYSIGLKKAMASSVALEKHRSILESIKNRNFDLYMKTYLEMIDYENLD